MKQKSKIPFQVKKPVWQKQKRGKKSGKKSSKSQKPTGRVITAKKSDEKSQSSVEVSFILHRSVKCLFIYFYFFFSLAVPF